MVAVTVPVYDFEVYVGTQWEDVVTYIDLTGYTGVMGIRAKDGTLLVSLTTENEMLAVTSTGMTRTLADTVTADFTPGTYVYDLVLTTPGGVTLPPLMRGEVFVKETVSL